MTDNKNKPSIIFVLGMHRSGTSLVAQMVAKWGAYMGKDLMTANEYNQDGYWEYNPLVNLHDRMLAYTGNTWYAPPKSVDVPHFIKVFGNEARVLVEEMDAVENTWCWKDPRMVIFLPFWQEILKDRNLLFIISFRNPLSVVDSLQIRDEIPTITATALWELYNLKVIEIIKDTYACFYAEYEKLINLPIDQTKKLFDFLNLNLRVEKSREVLQKMQTTIKPVLKHAIPPNHISIDKQQNELYLLLKQEKIPEIIQSQLLTRLKYVLEITDLYHKGNYYKERNLQIQLYYKHNGKLYSEKDSIKKKFEPNTKKIIFEFDEKSDIEFMRFDPLNDWAQCSCGQLELYNNTELVGTISASAHNGIHLTDGSLFFATRDPQIYFNFNNAKELSFNKVYIPINFLKVGNECKMFFAENPGLFFGNLLSKNESPSTTDNSFSVIYKYIEERMIKAKNIFRANEIILQKVRNLEVLMSQEVESNKTLEIVVQTHSKTIQSLEKEKNNLQNTIEKLNYEKEKLETALFASFTDNETLKVELAGIKNELNFAQNENKTLFNQVEAKENRLLQLQSELENRNKTIEEQNIKYNELSQVLQYKEKQMQEERNRLEQELKNTNDTLKRLMANERNKLVHKYHRRLPLRLAGNLWRFIKNPLQYYRMRRDTLIVRRSGLFNDAWYLQQYPDLYLTTVDMLQHYMLHGANEGRTPSQMFDAQYYLNTNSDVKEAGINPLLHYALYGKQEGRIIVPTKISDANVNSIPKEEFAEINHNYNKLIVGKNEPLPLNKNNSVSLHLTDIQANDYKALINSNVDWRDFFKFNDRLFEVDDPVEYYVRFWRVQNLIIPKFFDTKLYLNIYPDIYSAGINPLSHYIQHGITEKRVGFFKIEEHILKGEKPFDPDKKTLMIVCHESSATGAPLVGLNLGDELSKKFNIINVIIRKDSLNDCFLENSVITVTNLFYYPTPLLKSILEQIHNQYPIETIICNSIVSMPVLEAASQLIIPTITLLHEFSCYSKPLGQVARSIVLSDRIVVPASIIKESALVEFQKVYNSKNNPRNITIAPQGKLPFIPEGYGENFSVEKLQQQLKITNSKTKLIIGAGYVQIRKGVDLFISVAEKINEYYKGDVCFAWVGDGYDPETDYNYSLWLKIQLDSSSIKDKFTFLPHQKNLDNILKITDCFILSSRLDPFPNVVIDALDSDIFVACFERTTGCAEFMQEHNANCTVVPYLDIDKMALQVSNYLSLTDNERDTKMGINRSLVAKHLDFSKYSALIEHEIESAKSFAKRRMSIIKDIEDSNFFDHTFFSTIETTNEIDFYVKSALKGVHLASPLPGFSEKKWITSNMLDEYCVPLWEAIKRNEVKSTHNYLLLNGEQIKPKIKIAVHLHLYYSDLVEEFSNYLRNISVPFDLYITVPLSGTNKEIKDLSKLKNVRKLKIIEVENIGRDIIPLFINLKEIIMQGGYDVIGHFHSKKTIKNASMGERWRHYLLENLLGTEENLNQILNQFNDKEVGLIFAEDSHSVDIADNIEFANTICEAAKLPVIKNIYLYPLGTMFWARPSALKPFFMLDFKEFMQQEPLPDDGSYLHAFERLISHCVESSGYIIKTVYTKNTKWY